MTVHAHGWTGYTHGCRCEICSAEHTKVQRERFRASRAARAAEEAPHGTPGAYMNWSCRCDKCKSAYSMYLTDRRANRGY
jgi:hypothetical protein